MRARASCTMRSASCVVPCSRDSCSSARRCCSTCSVLSCWARASSEPLLSLHPLVWPEWGRQDPHGTLSLSWVRSISSSVLLLSCSRLNVSRSCCSSACRAAILSQCCSAAWFSLALSCSRLAILVFFSAPAWGGITLRHKITHRSRFDVKGKKTQKRTFYFLTLLYTQ